MKIAKAYRDKYEGYLIRPLPPPTCEIWIADDVIIHCKKRFQWWQRLMIRLFFGWKVKHV